VLCTRTSISGWRFWKRISRGTSHFDAKLGMVEMVRVPLLSARISRSVAWDSVSIASRTGGR